MNVGQPRAEKRVNKFAGCQVNDVEKLENLQLTWGLKKFFAGRGGRPGGVWPPRGVAPAEASRGTPRKDDGIRGGRAAAANR